ncbi:schizont egress antigen-1, putative [Plasmodium gallinaceum]|uniref:Schizont egress antigen-1, putative n=1 Tax=Plasmodium gallinaceum TaxID=5849 RepID=A0A1J1GXL4_PLAGA|nr:schizont egress antigen-1, putative [Plasmodium gallinaceum]CRG97231.1 schizont egress antigen-1, putative [Plasmodium gallinaceum]
MQSKCGNEDDSYCYINRYDLNELIENTEENEKSTESNGNNSICEYEIPFLLQDLESNKEDSEKNSLKSYLDDGASTIITKCDEENNIKKKKENIREKINIIIIKNKGVINNFEEILSMANVNDENIEKKLNDRFYQICCKSIADINTHNLNKAKDKKGKKGSLSIEHIDYGDIFLTIYDSLRNKKKDNNILHNSYENLRKYENSFKKKKMKNQYINDFKRSHYLKFHRKKENFYGNNLNNIIIDKNSNNSRKRTISYYQKNNAKKNIISKYNSHVIGYDELTLKDRTFLKNFYIKKNRKKDENMYYYDDYYKGTKLSNKTNLQNIENDNLCSPIYRNTYTPRKINNTNYFENEKNENINNCYYSRNDDRCFLESLEKNAHIDIKGLENVISYREEKIEENEEQNKNTDLAYNSGNDNNELIQKNSTSDKKHDNNLDHICDNKEVKNNPIDFNQLDIFYNKKMEDSEKFYIENDLNSEKKRKKNEHDDCNKVKNNSINDEDTLYDNYCKNVDNVLNKLENIDNHNDNYCIENKTYVKEDDEDYFSKKENKHNYEEKKIEINNILNKSSSSKICDYNESINSLSSLKKISEKDESYLSSKEDKDYFNFLAKKYEKTKIMMDEYENIPSSTNNVQKEEFLKTSYEILNDTEKKKEIVQEKERRNDEENDEEKDEKKDEKNVIKIFRRSSYEKYKKKYNENEVQNYLVGFKTKDNERYEKEIDKIRKENDIEDLKETNETEEHKIENKKKVVKNYEMGGYEKLLENNMYDLYNLKMHDLQNLKTYDFGFSKNLLKKDIFLYSESINNDECLNNIENDEKGNYSKEKLRDLDDNDEEKNILNYDESNKCLNLVNYKKEEYLENDEIKIFLEKLKVDITNQINLNNDTYSDKDKLENEQEFNINNENNQNAFDLLDSVHLDEYYCCNNEEILYNDESNLNNRTSGINENVDNNNMNDINENNINDVNSNFMNDANQSKYSYVGSKLKLSDLNESKENINRDSFLDDSKKYSEIKKDTECQTDFPLDFSRSINRTPRKKSVEVKLIEKKIKKKKEKERGNENEGENIRRYPKRNRIKTLRYWIGEREITERNPYTGEIDVIGFSECKNLEDLSPHIIGPIEYKNIYLKDIIDLKEKEYNDKSPNYDENIEEENNIKNDNKTEEKIVNDNKYNPIFNRGDNNNSDQNKIKNEVDTVNYNRKKRRRRKFINIVNYIKKKKKKKLIKSMDKIQGEKLFSKNNEEDSNLVKENINVNKMNYDIDNHVSLKENNVVIENNNVSDDCNIINNEYKKTSKFDNTKEYYNLNEDYECNNSVVNDFNLFFDDANIYDDPIEKKENSNKFTEVINSNTSYENKNEEIKEANQINEYENDKDINETKKMRENESDKDMNETNNMRENEIEKDLNETNKMRENEIEKDINETNKMREIEIEKDLNETNKIRENESDKDMNETDKMRENEIEKDINETNKMRENEIEKDINETNKMRENEIEKDINETNKIKENKNIININEIKKKNNVKKRNDYNYNKINSKYNREENVIENNSEKKKIISVKNKKITKKMKYMKRKKKERKIDKMYNQLSMVNLNFFSLKGKKEKSKSFISKNEEKKKTEKELKSEIKKKNLYQEKKKKRKNEIQKKEQKQKKRKKFNENNKLKKKYKDKNNNNYKKGKNKISEVDKNNKRINNLTKKQNNNNSKIKDELDKENVKKNSINICIRNNNANPNDLFYSTNINENDENKNDENKNDENKNNENKNDSIQININENDENKNDSLQINVNENDENKNDENKNDSIQININENDENKNDSLQINVNENDENKNDRNKNNSLQSYTNNNKNDKNKIIKNFNRHNIYLKILENMNKSDNLESYKNIISKKDDYTIYIKNEQKKKYSREKGNNYVEYDLLNKISLKENIEKKDLKHEDNKILLSSFQDDKNIVIRNAFLKTFKNNYKSAIIKKKKKKKITPNIKKNENIILKNNNPIEQKYDTHLNKIKFSLVYPFNSYMRDKNFYKYSYLSIDLPRIQKNFGYFKLDINLYCIKIDPDEKFINNSYESILIGYIDKGEKIKILLESEKCYEKGDFFFIPKFSNFIIINESRYCCILYIFPLNR